jgi:hypothetical protein
MTAIAIYLVRLSMPTAEGVEQRSEGLEDAAHHRHGDAAAQRANAL